MEPVLRTIRVILFSHVISVPSSTETFPTTQGEEVSTGFAGNRLCRLRNHRASLDDISYGVKTQLDGKKLYQCGDILAIQGVAWESLKGLDHYSSLAPRNWNGKSRKVRPPMRIMVKWVDKSKEGKGQEVVKRWEKRDAIQRCWQDERGNGNATVLCEEELKLGEVVILEKGESLSLCDFVIVTAAYQCEKRFKEWESEQRPGRDRSPTPGLPLMNSKNEKQPGSKESSDGKAQRSQATNDSEDTGGNVDT
ncbi:hypothetical protein NQ176_g2760 [Zarea fungicola]|uniref:Uncharacterized protein n=1 Tax=Zarea fungicola TaxID=93591 RepID=A0ACC1NMD1_9HYPO|nr:hypothetical protein NQ176_g2760 [Lecanicillium fungicola]